MPKYFLDLHEPAGRILDALGLEFGDLRGAEREALRALAQVAPDICGGGGYCTFKVVVSDEEGSLLELSATFEAKQVRSMAPRCPAEVLDGSTPAVWALAAG